MYAHITPYPPMRTFRFALRAVVPRVLQRSARMCVRLAVSVRPRACTCASACMRVCVCAHTCVHIFRVCTQWQSTSPRHAAVVSCCLRLLYYYDEQAVCCITNPEKTAPFAHRAAPPAPPPPPPRHHHRSLRPPVCALHPFPRRVIYPSSPRMVHANSPVSALALVAPHAYTRRLPSAAPSPRLFHTPPRPHPRHPDSKAAFTQRSVVQAGALCSFSPRVLL